MMSPRAPYGAGIVYISLLDRNGIFQLTLISIQYLQLVLLIFDKNWKLDETAFMASTVPVM